jgi:hypothetical protein
MENVRFLFNSFIKDASEIKESVKSKFSKKKIPEKETVRINRRE